jgi:DNA-binding Lrp family transcriptional regulator
MQFVIDQLGLLGLNAREIRTFTTLATFGQMKVTIIARRANLPRTTVDAIVRRLEGQGVIESVLVKRHVEWRVDLEKVGILLNILRGKIATSEHETNNLLDSDEFFVRKVFGGEHDALTENAAARYVCAVHLTPQGILLSDVSGKQGIHIAHMPLRLKVSESLPSILWHKEKKIEENEAG